MSVVVTTTIICDAAILRCASCQSEVATAVAVSDVDCKTCGGTMQFERRCETGITLHQDAILIRAIAENKHDWRCEDRGRRDFCPDHGHLVTRATSASSMPRAMSKL